MSPELRSIETERVALKPKGLRSFPAAAATNSPASASRRRQSPWYPRWSAAGASSEACDWDPKHIFWRIQTLAPRLHTQRGVQPSSITEGQCVLSLGTDTSEAKAAEVAAIASANGLGQTPAGFARVPYRKRE